jgi:hypothetical protein
VDIYDPFDDIDRWLDDTKLAEFKLYREGIPKKVLIYSNTEIAYKDFGHLKVQHN